MLMVIFILIIIKIYNRVKPNKSLGRKKDYLDFNNKFKKDELFNDINNINYNFK